MKVIILAAGEGTRLRPYTLDRPKCLVEIEGRSLLDRQLEVLRSRGLQEIFVVGGYRSDLLEHRDFELRINPQYAETNMVWTLFSAEDILCDDVIIAYGDIVYSGDILDQLIKSTADIAVAVDLDWETYWRARNENPLDDAETLKMTEDGRIIEIGQKPNSIEEIQGQYMGLIKFTFVGLSKIKVLFNKSKENNSLSGKAPENAYMTDLLQEVINSGFKVDSVPVHGGWVEVDTVSDLNSSITRDRLDYVKESIHVDV